MNRVPFHTLEDARTGAPRVRAHLDAGGLIAYPTETVYGIGGLLTRQALQSLAALKNRDADRPVLVLSHDPRRIKQLQWNDAALILADRFWPGPLTIALAAEPDAFEAPVLSAAGTVAIRHTSQPALLTLLALLDAPITSTSANLPGEPPATNADALAALDMHHTHDALDVRGHSILILDGGTLPARQPSTVIDCAGPTPRLIRAGAVPRELLEAALNSGGFSLDG
ncbi:MAG: L-threonylcarbamoyladenylate synthase [Longimicrobiales bacterium]